MLEEERPLVDVRGQIVPRRAEPQEQSRSTEAARPPARSASRLSDPGQHAGRHGVYPYQAGPIGPASGAVALLELLAAPAPAGIVAADVLPLGLDDRPRGPGGRRAVRRTWPASQWLPRRCAPSRRRRPRSPPRRPATRARTGARRRSPPPPAAHAGARPPPRARAARGRASRRPPRESRAPSSWNIRCPSCWYSTSGSFCAIARRWTPSRR